MRYNFFTVRDTGKKYKWDKAKMARELNVSRTTIYKWLDLYDEDWVKIDESIKLMTMAEIGSIRGHLNEFTELISEVIPYPDPKPTGAAAHTKNKESK